MCFLPFPWPSCSSRAFVQLPTPPIPQVVPTQPIWGLYSKTSSPHILVPRASPWVVLFWADGMYSDHSPACYICCFLALPHCWPCRHLGCDRWYLYFLCNLQIRKLRFNLWVRKIPWGWKWEPTPVFLPREFHGQGAWRAMVHGITKSQTWRKWLSSSSNDTRNNTMYAFLFRAIVQQ